MDNRAVSEPILLLFSVFGLVAVLLGRKRLVVSPGAIPDKDGQESNQLALPQQVEIEPVSDSSQMSNIIHTPSPVQPTDSPCHRASPD